LLQLRKIFLISKESENERNTCRDPGSHTRPPILKCRFYILRNSILAGIVNFATSNQSRQLGTLAILHTAPRRLPPPKEIEAFVAVNRKLAFKIKPILICLLSPLPTML
jgi:hypothetical protein